MTRALYDNIGIGYARYRRPDERIAARLMAALGPARTVVNVGAGAGSYEPLDRQVVAVEPSAAMLAQRERTTSSALLLRGLAESLPFREGSFDAALAILTLHHWTDWRRGLREMRRVARDRVVVLTWDPAHAGFWLTQEYFPQIPAIDRQIFPRMAEMSEVLGPLRVDPVHIPCDCTDGFLGAYWRRPECYLDPDARRAISAFAKITGAEPVLERLASDIRSGSWHEKNRSLLDLAEIDLGYRIVTSAMWGADTSGDPPTGTAEHAGPSHPHLESI